MFETGALVNETNSVSTATGRSKPAVSAGKKPSRRMLLKTCQILRPHESIRLCQTVLRFDQKAVNLRVVDGAHGKEAFAGGLYQCGRIWDCPMCSAGICKHRREELGELIRAQGAAGGQVWMTALTIPHARFDDLKGLRCAVSNIWRKVQGGRAWKDEKLETGFQGSVRALEVTHGKNGWHPHLHILFFFDGSIAESRLQEFGAWLFERWAGYVAEAGQGKCNANVFQFERARSSEQAGNYVMKWGSEWEMLGAQGKAGKNGNRTPWQILDDCRKGDRAAGRLFVTYSEGMKGARQLTYSRGLRQKFSLREPGSDEDVIAEMEAKEAAQDGGVGESIGFLSPGVFFRIDRRGLFSGLLAAIEAEPSWETVLLFLRRHGIEPDSYCSRTRVHWFDASAL